MWAYRAIKQSLPHLQYFTRPTGGGGGVAASSSARLRLEAARGLAYDPELDAIEQDPQRISSSLRVVRGQSAPQSGRPRLVAPSTGCFTPWTAFGPPLRQGVRLGGPVSPYLGPAQVGVLNRLALNHLGSSTARLRRAISSRTTGGQ